MDKNDIILYVLFVIILALFLYSFDFALNNSPLLRG